MMEGMRWTLARLYFIISMCRIFSSKSRYQSVDSLMRSKCFLLSSRNQSLSHLEANCLTWNEILFLGKSSISAPPLFSSSLWLPCISIFQKLSLRFSYHFTSQNSNSPITVCLAKVVSNCGPKPQMN